MLGTFSHIAGLNCALVSQMQSQRSSSGYQVKLSDVSQSEQHTRKEVPTPELDRE